MYQDRIHRTTPNNSQPQLNIRLPEIAYDERVKYIESVCATLIESRFGPSRISPLVITLSDRPERGATVFYDMCEGEPSGLIPCYALSPLGRAGYQVVEAAFRRAKQMGLVDAAPAVLNSPSALTPNQGRGSP